MDGEEKGICHVSAFLAFLSEQTTLQNSHASLFHGPSSDQVCGEKAPSSDTSDARCYNSVKGTLTDTLGPTKVDGDTWGSECETPLSPLPVTAPKTRPPRGKRLFCSKVLFTL